MSGRGDIKDFRQEGIPDGSGKKHQDWDEICKAYELVKTPSGNHVYKYKNDDKPIHMICPLYYKDKKISILQAKMVNGYYSCHRCKNSIKVGS